MDERSFAEAFDQHRRELQVHCYRMLGSFEEAEDLVQETFLRAWNKRDTFDGSELRAWLYRIATNASIDAVRRRSRQVKALDSFAEVPWLQPYPDVLLDEVVARETVELTFLAAIQLLPARQRAALIMRDVLGWSAAETASILDSSVAAVNSALQRARAVLRDQLPAERGEWSTPEPSPAELELLRRYISAHEQPSHAAMAALAREDIRVTMPPLPFCYNGLASLDVLFERAFGSESMGHWRVLPTRANRMPAAACYLRRWDDTEFRAFKLDVIRCAGDRIAEITTFDATLFPAFGLPETVTAH
jgi:RNA polymerase sigma-70 factor (ECF subfamily)